jgi:hypothetical protein
MTCSGTPPVIGSSRPAASTGAFPHHERTRIAACECDQIGPEERAYSRFFSQEQAIIAEMRMAAYLMLEGLGMIRGWLRNIHEDYQKLSSASFRGSPSNC